MDSDTNGILTALSIGFLNLSERLPRLAPAAKEIDIVVSRSNTHSLPDFSVSWHGANFSHKDQYSDPQQSGIADHTQYRLVVARPFWGQMAANQYIPIH